MRIECVSPGYVALPSLSDYYQDGNFRPSPAPVSFPWKAFSRPCPLHLTRSLPQPPSPSSVPIKAGSSHIAPLVLPSSSLPGEQC